MMRYRAVRDFSYGLRLDQDILVEGMRHLVRHARESGGFLNIDDVSALIEIASSTNDHRMGISARDEVVRQAIAARDIFDPDADVEAMFAKWGYGRSHDSVPVARMEELVAGVRRPHAFLDADKVVAIAKEASMAKFLQNGNSEREEIFRLAIDNRHLFNPRDSSVAIKLADAAGGPYRNKILLAFNDDACKQLVGSVRRTRRRKAN